MQLTRVGVWAPILLAMVGCQSSSPSEVPDPCAGTGALAECLTPKQSPSYYIEQALYYFDTLDGSADPSKVPNYSRHVARWEWPPWLKLTGYGRAILIEGDRALTTLDPDTTVPLRDCRAFTKQPFARCRVSFDYAGKRCAIYEEFFFNDAGDTTFIEAWSDMPGQLPMSDPNDAWGEGPNVHRLGSKVPTLGATTGDMLGDMDIDDPSFDVAAARDPEINDLLERSKNFTASLSSELATHGSEAHMYAIGCGWPEAADAGAAR